MFNLNKALSLSHFSRWPLSPYANPHPLPLPRSIVGGVKFEINFIQFETWGIGGIAPAIV